MGSVAEMHIKGFVFPDDIDGWLMEEEAVELAYLSIDKTVLEIGSYCGRSAVCMAQTAKYVATIDAFDGRCIDNSDYAGVSYRSDAYSELLKSLEKYGVQEKVSIHCGTSSLVVPNLERKYDFAFIDGAHDYASVVKDTKMVKDKLLLGGLMVYHDYKNRAFDGVTQAVDFLLSRGALLVGLTNTLAVLNVKDMSV